MKYLFTALLCLSFLDCDARPQHDKVVVDQQGWVIGAKKASEKKPEWEFWMRPEKHEVLIDIGTSLKK